MRKQVICRGFAALLLAATTALGCSSLALAADSSWAYTVNIGMPPWPGATIKSQVVAAILKPLGYPVEYTKASAPIIYLSLSQDKVDVNLSAWSPGQASSFMPYVKQHKIVKLGENLTGATSGFAVPNYMVKQGLTSDTQLAAHAKDVDATVHCIEPGSGANNIVEKAIKNNTYGLGDWHMKHSSTAAMLAEAKRAIDQHKPIVFCGWQPHWMNVALDMTILKDPKSLWGPNGGHSQVLTLVSAGFVKRDPNLARFFRQFQVDSATQSQWVYQSSYKKQDHQQVADQWIAAHLDEVAGWLKGVKAADGQPAAEVMRRHFGS
ncbi:glycine betaine ABC transporter substrate-binding protein [Salinisphaera hydrothermalis]|uniref:glycine betaine ABC transporter substrate-binding protein n=1 Tax=Salinisphaera hydrothermalis TaxID=563188 RepID=UPI0033423F26